jgi:hypothetical protein
MPKHNVLEITQREEDKEKKNTFFNLMIGAILINEAQIFAPL